MCIKEHGKIKCVMEKVFYTKWMAPNMKDTGKRISKMDMVWKKSSLPMKPMMF